MKTSDIFEMQEIIETNNQQWCEVVTRAVNDERMRIAGELYDKAKADRMFRVFRHNTGASIIMERHDERLETGCDIADGLVYRANPWLAYFDHGLIHEVKDELPR
jgi:hypothetical protein